MEPLAISMSVLVIIATILIARDSIAPNKNNRGKIARRNLELSSDPNDENAEGDTTVVKKSIDPTRAEQRNINMRLLLKQVYVYFIISFKNRKCSFSER